jgi:ABC-type branched-subunit amino acid transport system ATPase component
MNRLASPQKALVWEQRKLGNFIRRLRDEFDLSILLIEHDMKVVMGVCEHIWVLDQGMLIGVPRQGDRSC